jgi:hypothetical protein
VIGKESRLRVVFTLGPGTPVLQTGWVLINTALDGRGACYIAFFRPGNLLLLIPDDGDGSRSTVAAVGGTDVLENSQCRVWANQASLQSFRSPLGNQESLEVRVEMKGAFAGPKGVWTGAQTTDGKNPGWLFDSAWHVVP